MYEYGLLLLRVLAGIGILTHGIPKLNDLPGTKKWMRSVGLPSAAGVFAAVVETLGGILLVLGVFVNIVAAILLINMLGALFFHLKAKHTFKQSEDAFLYAAIFATLVVTGGGAFALTHFALLPA